MQTDLEFTMARGNKKTQAYQARFDQRRAQEQERERERESQKREREQEREKQKLEQERESQTKQVQKQQRRQDQLTKLLAKLERLNLHARKLMGSVVDPKHLNNYARDNDPWIDVPNGVSPEQARIIIDFIRLKNGVDQTNIHKIKSDGLKIGALTALTDLLPKFRNYAKHQLINHDPEIANALGEFIQSLETKFWELNAYLNRHRKSVV